MHLFKTLAVANFQVNLVWIKHFDQLAEARTEPTSGHVYTQCRTIQLDALIRSYFRN
jgi:hypothetical protein